MGVNRVSRGNKGVCSVSLLSHQSLSFFNKLLEKETQLEVSRCSACTWRHLQALQGISKSVPKGKMKKVVSIFSRFYCVEGSLFLAAPEVEGRVPKTRLNVVDAGLSSESRGCSCGSSVAQPWLGVPDSTETHPALITS